MQRDRKEKNERIFKHIEQRQQLNLHQRSKQHRHDLEIEQLRQDIQEYRTIKSDKLSKLQEEFRKASEKPRRIPKAERDRNHDHGFEPEI